MNKLIKLLLAVLLLFPFPITGSYDQDGKWVFGVTSARADSDDDDDDDDDDDRDDKDDRNDNDVHDDDDDDRDDDRADPNRPSATPGRPSSQNSDRPENLHLRYPNGWDEKIRSGRYILIDPEGRTVTNRAATFADLDRMRDVAGL